jgi:hypothetical protein
MTPQASRGSSCLIMPQTASQEVVTMSLRDAPERQGGEHAICLQASTEQLGECRGHWMWRDKQPLHC